MQREAAARLQRALEEASRQRDVATARQLAAQARLLLDNDDRHPRLAALLGAESLRLCWTLEGHDVLRRAITRLRSASCPASNGR